MLPLPRCDRQGLGTHEQSFRAPSGGEAEGDQECGANESSGSVAFAPTLEHGDQSNREQDDGGDGKNLNPHLLLPLIPRLPIA